MTIEVVSGTEARSLQRGRRKAVPYRSERSQDKDRENAFELG